MAKGRFTPDEKIRVVLEFLNTNIGTAELCRKHRVQPPTFYRWRDKFLDGGKASIRGSSLADAMRSLRSENESLKTMIGEITMANDILKKTLEGRKR